VVQYVLTHHRMPAACWRELAKARRWKAVMMASGEPVRWSTMHPLLNANARHYHESTSTRSPKVLDLQRLRRLYCRKTMRLRLVEIISADSK
jgi:hypothetical protein